MKQRETRVVAEYKSNNIKVLMEKHGLTIESLAKELNLSVSTINRLLVDSKSDPKLSTLYPIAKLFKISIDELIGDRPLSFKAGSSENGFDNQQTLVQVPIIAWEHLKDASKIVPDLTFQSWDHWTPATELAGHHSYGLQIKQSSLPPPFYFLSIIVVDPEREPVDSDYAIVLHHDNPIICKVIFNGMIRLFQSLAIGNMLEQNEVQFCGKIIQWTIYSERKNIEQNDSVLKANDGKSTVKLLKKHNEEYMLDRRLDKAVKKADITEVKKLIQKGAVLHKLQNIALHKYNSEHETLLRSAIKIGDLEIIKLLLSQGSNINAKNKQNRTPLHYATYPTVPIMILKLLLEHGAKLEAKDNDNASAFMWACYLNNVDAVKFLLKKNVDVYSRDNFGLSPLEWSAFEGNLETVEVLVREIDYTEKQLKSAYDKAIENNRVTVISFLENQLSKAN